jgi:hypothetical protein
MSRIYNHLSISPNRTKELLFKTKEKATELGMWDSFLDLFRPVSKKEMLSKLFDDISQKSSNPVDKFIELAKLVKPEHLPKFQVNLTNEVKAYREPKGTLHFVRPYYIIPNIEHEAVLKIAGKIIATVDITSDERNKLLIHMKECTDRKTQIAEQPIGDYILRKKQFVYKFKPEFLEAIKRTEKLIAEAEKITADLDNFLGNNNG